VVTGTCQFFTHGVESWHPNPDFYYRPGGGPVFDMGPYYLSALINLLGPVRAVTAMSTKGVDERVIGNGKRLGERIAVELPTSFTSILDFYNGAQITFATSWDVWRDGHTNPIELYGVDGTMLLPDPNYFGGTLAWSNRDGEYATLDASSEPFGATNWPMEEPKVSNYRMLGVADMVDAIGSGRQARCSGALAAHIIEVMEAIQTSAAEQRFVTIGSSIERPEAMTAQDAVRLQAGS
jgi:predicted dehydrogenase